MRHDRPRARSAPNFALWPSYVPRCLGKDEVRSGRTVNPDSASEEQCQQCPPARFVPYKARAWKIGASLRLQLVRRCASE
jgi:hypothetical protein